MTYINIFLVCSAEDLHDDGLEISDFISTLNDLYVQRDLFFNLSLCEDEDTAAEEMEKQKQEDHDIQDSQLFVIMFYKKIGEYAMDKFNEAYDQFKESGAPAILTFFRTDGSDPTAEVKDFMDRLDQELGHYFKTYSDIDALKLYLLMQIKSMGLDTAIVFENGQASVGNEPILSIDHLPELIKNTDWKKLKEDQEKIEEEFVEAQAAYVSDMNNETAYKQFIEIANKRNTLKEQIEQLEGNIIDLTCKSVADSTKGNLTARQRKAYQLLEQGKYREADMILDKGEILADIDHVKNLKHSANEQLNRQLESYVDELLSKIDIKMTLVEDPDRFREIEELYEEAVKLEADESLDRKATRQYIVYLEVHQNFLRGTELARQFLEYACQTNNTDKILDGKECLASLLSHQTSNEECRTEAVSLYYEILEDFYNKPPDVLAVYVSHKGFSSNDIVLSVDDLIDETMEYQEFNHEIDLAENYIKLAQLLGIHNNTENLSEAKALCWKAIKVMREAVENHPGMFVDDLALTISQVADFLIDHINFGRPDEMEVEGLLRDVLDIRRKLATKNMHAAYYEECLVTCCNRLASFLDNRNHLDDRAEVENLYREALEISRRLDTDNPNEYELLLASSYNNLATFLIENNQEDNQSEAEELFREELKIRRRLASCAPAVHEEVLASRCDNLAALLDSGTGKESQSETEALYREALDIRRRQANRDPNKYEHSLAMSCNTLANFLDNRNDAGDREEAAALYREMIEIFSRLAVEDPSKYEPELAISCINLAELLYDCNDAVNREEIEKFYREALKIFRGLTAKYPKLYESDLASCCNNLAFFLNERHEKNDLEEVEALYREALDIKRRLADENEDLYDADLATGCINLAIFLYKRNVENDKEDAEILYREAVEIWRRLATENPGEYEADLAFSLDSLGVLISYHDNPQDMVEAEKMCREALTIRRRLAASDPNRYDNDLSLSCNNAAYFPAKRQDEESQQKAEDLYREALAIRRRLFKEDPASFEGKVAFSCFKLAGVLANRDDNKSLDEAEDLFRESIEIRRRLAEADPEQYDKDLTASCDALESLQNRRAGHGNANTGTEE